MSKRWGKIGRAVWKAQWEAILVLSLVIAVALAGSVITETRRRMSST
jgi:hypothetical protein